MTAGEPFELLGPLPQGTVLLEASAGTGKTFTIAALAARLVAEAGAPVDSLLLVTFGRTATGELRERVRERLMSAARGLADPAAARASDDALLAHLAAGDAEQVEQRRRRLAAAVADFDAATIATTHGFCQQMLVALGVLGDLDPGLSHVDDVADLVTEVGTDLYLARYAAGPVPERPPPDLPVTVVRSVLAEAVRDAQAELLPVDADPDSEAGMRRLLAAQAREEVLRRKRDRRLIDYDDLLTRLLDALADPGTGAAARQRLRDRYRFVLVDEFQDTDPVQWQILRAAFHGSATLVLIGDPKQAIYAFRGGDVEAYLAAATDAGEHRTLVRNHRSDAALLAGMAGLFRGASLGDPRIVAHPVVGVHEGRRLLGAPGAPLRLRQLSRAALGEPADAGPPVAAVRRAVAVDVAAEVVRLLESKASLELDGQPPRPVAPGDVAVLVRTNDQALLVRDALRAVDVPAVVTGARSVFSSDAAQDWLVLLRALEQQHRPGLLRAAALTCFLGWDAARLATAVDADVDALAATLRRWSRVLADRGVAALTEVVTAEQGLPSRVLGRTDGDRLLTDVRHVAQALHEAAVAEGLGVTALAEWLQRRITEAEQDADTERSRRLETDADAVQVVTVHTSKGLEFPVVLVPFAWDRYVKGTPEWLRLHDSGRRALDVGGPGGPRYPQHRQVARDEEAGEDLRLLYVAVTRAQCQLLLWWAPSHSSTASSALHRLLFADLVPTDDGSPAVPGTVKVLPDAGATARLAAWVRQVDAVAPGSVSHEVVSELPAVEPWRAPAVAAPVLAVAEFDRPLDRAWRRTSYTALTATAYEAAHEVRPGVSSEPEDELRQDEPAVRPVTAAMPDLLAAVPSPFDGLPAGTAFGTLVHAVLEAADPAVPGGDEAVLAELRRSAELAVARRPGEPVDPGALAAALLPVVRTPLGPSAGGRALADVPRADRLAELAFELPLAGGDRPGGTRGVGLGDVADLLADHLPADDPLAGYAQVLRDPLLRGAPLRGYLTGSVDAVLRLHDLPGQAQPRYVVVDYKTNRLGDVGVPGTAWDYRQPALVEAMTGAHYPVQALLYLVALHRFLRWRQPGYDPAQHLGGALYLFLRGMCGPDTPSIDGRPTGVLAWSPPADLVVALSDLLDRGAR